MFCQNVKFKKIHFKLVLLQISDRLSTLSEGRSCDQGKKEIWITSRQNKK